MPDTRETRTDGGEALTALILHSFTFHGLLTSAGDELTAPWGLSSARWKVLGAIAGAGRPLHVAQIARNMGLTRQAVQRLVHELAEYGLVVLTDNPDHKRASLVSFTERGKTAYSEIMIEQARWSNDLAGDIDPQELKNATCVVSTLCERLQQQSNK